MLAILNEHLNDINAKIEAVKAVDNEAEIKAKVAAYEDTVRIEYAKAKSAEIDRLNGIKLGIQYVIDAEAQKQAELKAAEEERNTAPEQTVEKMVYYADAVGTTVSEES